MGRAGGGRIELATMFNVRELGGYRTPNGLTKSRRFLRAGDTMCASDEDLQALLDYGVRRVVDLRMSVERPELTDRFAGLAGVAWMSAAMQDERTLTPDWAKTGRVVDFLLEGYRIMLADHAGLRDMFSFMAEATCDECVLFHCAAGMDRTGIVSALLLGSVGVVREDLVADYAYSFATDETVDEAIATWDSSQPPPSHDGMRARICAMFEVYDGLVRKHGSVRQYLLDIGLSARTLDRLASHLLA